MSFRRWSEDAALDRDDRVRSTWYHGPFAAGFFQSGDTWDLHFIAPQFLAWFYPANGEIFHAAGMLAFGRDVLSPLLNIGWFVGCLVACWCIGRPYRVAPWSLALGAIALSVPAFADQAGEARNDIVGIFFLLAAVAVMVNAWARIAGVKQFSPHTGDKCALAPSVSSGLPPGWRPGRSSTSSCRQWCWSPGLARSLRAARGAALSRSRLWRLWPAAATGSCATSPTAATRCPGFDHLGPIYLPAPEQALGGREAHSVLGYLDRRQRLVRLVPPRPPQRPMAPLAPPASQPPCGPDARRPSVPWFLSPE